MIILSLNYLLKKKDYLLWTTTSVPLKAEAWRTLLWRLCASVGSSQGLMEINRQTESFHMCFRINQLQVTLESS